jgi:hypothetical protein
MGTMKGQNMSSTSPATSPESRPVPRTMYEIDFPDNWHHNIEDIKVLPVKVIREGILEGCSAPTITIIDSKGRKCNTSPDLCFETEQAAWEHIRKELFTGIAILQRDIDTGTAQLNSIKAFIQSKWGIIPH